MAVARAIASLGTLIATARIGSSSTGPAFSSASLMPMRAAVRKAMSEESTEW